MMIWPDTGDNRNRNGSARITADAEIVLLNQSREDLKGLRASEMETGKANHSDPYTRPPQGGCILYFFCLANILSTTAAALFSEFQRSIL